MNPMRNGQLIVRVNPYLTEVKNHIPDIDDLETPWYMRIRPDHLISMYELRHAMIEKYAFAIPNERVLDRIVDWSPIIEVGAGLGYWAWCLQQRGADVIATDIQGSDWKAWFPHQRTFTEVLKLDAVIAVKQCQDRTLLIVWPYMDTMATRALQAYKGKRVVYVGEWKGCTAKKSFFQALERDWNEVDNIAIPQWDGIHDQAWFYERKEKK